MASICDCVQENGGAYSAVNTSPKNTKVKHETHVSRQHANIAVSIMLLIIPMGKPALSSLFSFQ